MHTPMHECLEWQHVHRVGEARAHQTTPMTAAIAMTTMTITTITTPAAIPPDEPGKGVGQGGGSGVRVVARDDNYGNMVRCDMVAWLGV